MIHLLTVVFVIFVLLLFIDFNEYKKIPLNNLKGGEIDE
jgi:hypothetical protein